MPEKKESVIKLLEKGSKGYFEVSWNRKRGWKS